MYSFANEAIGFVHCHTAEVNCRINVYEWSISVEFETLVKTGGGACRRGFNPRQTLQEELTVEQEVL